MSSHDDEYFEDGDATLQRAEIFEDEGRIPFLDIAFNAIKARLGSIDGAYFLQEDVWDRLWRDAMVGDMVDIYFEGEVVKIPLAFIQDTHLATFFGLDLDKITGGEKISKGQANTTSIVFKALNLDPSGKKQRILDAGSGIGGFARYVAAVVKNVEIDAVNLSRKQIHRAEQVTKKARKYLQGEINYYEADVTKFRSGEPYDYVVFFESLLHMGDRVRALSNAEKNLKPGGRIVMTEVSFAEGNEELQRKIEKDFNSKFQNPEETAAILEKLGFQNIAIEDLTEYIRPLIHITLKRIDSGILDKSLNDKFGPKVAETIKQAWRDFADVFDNWGYYLISADKPLYEEA